MTIKILNFRSKSLEKINQITKILKSKRGISLIKLRQISEKYLFYL